MCDEPRLSDEEWELITELLEREQSELPVEIRHTRNLDVRAGLQHRAALVRHLLDRLRPAETVCGG